jgi:hypothetical protein
MSVYSLIFLVSLSTVILANPLSPYMGLVWITDPNSLSTCRNDCGKLCCPLNATLSVQGVNNNMYLFINIDPQSATKCGVSSYTTYAAIDNSSSSAFGANFTSTFIGISFSASIDSTNNDDLSYVFPIVGGNGNCNLNAPSTDLKAISSTTSPNDGLSTTSDANIVSVLYVIVILCCIFLFLS